MKLVKFPTLMETNVSLPCLDKLLFQLKIVKSKTENPFILTFIFISSVNVKYIFQVNTFLQVFQNRLLYLFVWLS